MIRWKSIAGAFAIGLVLAVAVVLLARVPATPAGLATCCLGFAIYPLVGAAYALIGSHPTTQPLHEAVGGALSAFAVLIAQFELAVLISSTDPLESFNQGLTSAPPPYADNPALIVIGLVFGFGVVLLFVAAAGAIPAVLVSLARRRRQA